LRDAYLKVAPPPEHLRTLHDKCAPRRLDCKGWRPEDMQSIKTPTLVIIGDADGVRPEHAVEMFRLLPPSRLAVLPSDHGPYLGEMTAAKQNRKLPLEAMCAAKQ
jgi:pimeloyl-ACP methyl ester carboxylesterase